MNSITPSIETAEELEGAFQRFLHEIAGYYSPEQVGAFEEWHRKEEFSKKLTDPKRFFRIIRGEKGEIIAYFESKEHGSEPHIQVIQWFFVDRTKRQEGVLKGLMEEFETWCRERGYTVIWSYSALKNEVSNRVHDTIFPHHDIVDMGFGSVDWYRKNLQ